ncbi:hypothetical protein DXG01_009888 [Tephrocybe rancida]|nr:hypothetical protein DXG01_009888 [Tephrocybe rancida]
MVNFFGDFPIPRTEYQEFEFEFGLENLRPLHRPPSFSGLLALTLPPEGTSLDIKVRLIPATIPSSPPDFRSPRGYFHVVEPGQISEDVHLQVKQVLAMFKPIFVLRLRDVLEKTLAGQANAIAYDVGKRREVFEGTDAVGGGAAFLAAIWGRVGRLRWKSALPGMGVEWHPTGTGVVVEQGHGGLQFAMGTEPQILSGNKRVHSAPRRNHSGSVLVLSCKTLRVFTLANLRTKLKIWMWIVRGRRLSRPLGM